jgi:hypothetical protein
MWNAHKILKRKCERKIYVSWKHRQKKVLQCIWHKNTVTLWTGCGWFLWTRQRNLGFYSFTNWATNSVIKSRFLMEGKTGKWHSSKLKMEAAGCSETTTTTYQTTRCDNPEDHSVCRWQPQMPQTYDIYFLSSTLYMNISPDGRLSCNSQNGVLV